MTESHLLQKRLCRNLKKSWHKKLSRSDVPPSTPVSKETSGRRYKKTHRSGESTRRVLYADLKTSLIKRKQKRYRKINIPPSNRKFAAVITPTDFHWGKYGGVYECGEEYNRRYRQRTTTLLHQESHSRRSPNTADLKKSSLALAQTSLTQTPIQEPPPKARRKTTTATWPTSSPQDVTS